MTLIRSTLLIFLVTFCTCIYTQPAFDSVKFFHEEKPLVLKLTTDISNLISGKQKDVSQNALFSCKLPDSSELKENITITVRGHMRRSICNVPPVKLNFKKSPRLSSLNSLKLVTVCRGGAFDGQLLLKEYLVYKIFNLLTDKSFRVRLVNLTYEDTKERKKPMIWDAFFVEDVDALAKREKCKELNNIKTNSELTDRKQMTLVNLFEFMIGNTDWSVPNNHNIKLLKSKKDSLQRPIPVPYDFDYSGLVNAEYATPDPIMNVESVLTRVYRGFPRKMEELQEAILVFNKQKESIYALIKNFAPLSSRNKSEMTDYLDDFYKIINKPSEVKYYFIDNARTQ